MKITVEKKARLDLCLKNILPYSRNFIKNLILDGKILINQKTIVRPSFSVKAGDVIDVPEEKTSQPDSLIKSEQGPLEILFEDNYLIVVNKPAGIITHPTVRILSGTLLNRVLGHTQLAEIGSPYRPGVVHRLDKGTSGVMVFAKNNNAYWNLVEQFKNRRVNKTYLAIVWGLFPEKEKTVEINIAAASDDKTRMKPHYLRGKKTITEIKVLQYLKKATLLEVHPLTGRTHQIRVVLSHLGFPILGDKKYSTVEDMQIDRTALHSRKLSFFHPVSDKPLTFEAPSPSDFETCLGKFK